MSDDAYLVDPSTKKLERVGAISLTDLGIKEVRDLQDWILKMPAMLGEELLIISSQFSRFDKSNRRLDVLALDKEFTLVVIELKLELDRSFADQQAIRYAALCSTMTTQAMIEEMSSYHGISEGEATIRLSKFLGNTDLPELNNRPRIILAAGSLDDPELTATVLWLRTFDLDITCIELTPYRMPSKELLLVPRVIIPLPEAKDFMVSVEKKAIVKAEREKITSKYSAFWALVNAAYDSLNFGHGFRVKERNHYMQLGIPESNHVHYEWWIRRREGLLDVALHFESSKERNLALLAELEPHRSEIVKGASHEFKMARWGEKYAAVAFSLPINQMTLDQPLAQEAVRTMGLLIGRTWPILEKALREKKL